MASRAPTPRDDPVDAARRSSYASAESGPDKLTAERIWWSDALIAAIQRMLHEQTKQLEACFADETKKEAKVEKTQQLMAVHAEEQLRECVVEEIKRQAWQSQCSLVSAQVQQMSAEHAEDGSAVEAHRLQDSWKKELQGIRSELGALRASLEGRPALEEELRRYQVQPRQGPCGEDPQQNDLHERKVPPATCTRSEPHVGALVEVRQERGDASGTPLEEGADEGRAPAGSPVQGCLSSHLQGRAGQARRESIADDMWLQAKDVPIFGPCLGAVGKLGTSEAPQRSDPLSKFVDSPLFSAMVYSVILLNCVFMITSADEDIHVAIHDPSREPSDLSSYGERFFLIVYSLELILKLWRFRLYFFCDPSWKYNWLDFVLVLISIYSEFFEGMLPNLSWLRMLRMLKLAKALRVLRLISMVKPLRAILQSLIQTVSTLAWSIVMLLVCLFLFALILVIRVTSFLQEEPGQSQVVMGEHGETVTDLLEANYGSIGLTILHLFMCSTGGNDWSVYYDPLRPTGTINCLLFLFFIAFTQIALLNIILGIFVDDAMKSMVIDADERAEEHAEEQRQMANELRNICYECDINGDAMLSPVEWRHAIETSKMQKYLDMRSFRPAEVKEFLEHMGEGGAIHIETFVELIMRFRGTASCFDMQMLLNEVQIIKSLLQGA